MKAHWEQFRERAEDAGGLPTFVVREFEEYLSCGILDRGCLHLACRICGYFETVALSCKRRGFWSWVDAWPTRPSTSSRASCPPCPCGTGSARCHGACAPCSATIGLCAPKSSARSSASCPARSDAEPSVCSHSAASLTRTPGLSRLSRGRIARFDSTSTPTSSPWMAFAPAKTARSSSIRCQPQLAPKSLTSPAVRPSASSASFEPTAAPSTRRCKMSPPRSCSRSPGSLPATPPPLRGSP
ncbi:MAG: transposase zinc-binding domain-containing protein [Deltaproteobacteria bacterium]|nr:transposase zinc-binding domain-containing protein [Deltaproteobacteria bacterium]